jgi:hypothetical protein
MSFDEPDRHEQRSCIIRISNKTTVDYLYSVDGKVDQLENRLSSVAKVVEGGSVLTRPDYQSSCLRLARYSTV